jgi:hypothetical protein
MSSFYIYALKDPRSSPARAFYIGKGTGVRAWEHTAVADETRKGKRISEIQAEGAQVVVSVLADGLSEMQALKLEAELISAFGTETTGGLLTNSVVPSGKADRVRKGLVIPSGSLERAQIGLQLLKDAVLELARSNPNGVTNSDVAHSLGLQADYAGGSKDYLSWSLLGLLMREGKVKRESSSKKHVALLR